MFGFVDGTKLRQWLPCDKIEQDLRYDGHPKFHCSVAFVWFDTLGMITHLDFSDEGSDDDISLFNGRTTIRNQAFHFSEGEHAKEDTGFQGSAPLFCPFKINQGYAYPYQNMIYRDIQ